MRRALVLAALLAITGVLPPAIASATELPVEAFVSLPSLFPRDGVFAPDGTHPYRPYPAFASPDGVQIGHVESSFGACKADCDVANAYLVTPAGKRHALSLDYMRDDTHALLTYEPPVVACAMAWSKIRFANGAFWIKTLRHDLHRFDDLATLVNHFDAICTRPGQCRPLPAPMRNQLDRLAIHGCVDLPYEIARVITFKGKRYYKLRLQKTDADAPLRKVPAINYIPTRNSDGNHTGMHEPHGC